MNMQVSTINRSAAILDLHQRSSMSRLPSVNRTVLRGTPTRCSAAAKPVVTPSPLVKVCGVTSPEDAAQAAGAGAAFVGMILWPNAKRSIEASVAKEVVAAARENGAEPVGVFVSENAEQIIAFCDDVGISWAQLHGDGSRKALKDLPTKYKAIYVMNADVEGKLLTLLPGDDEDAVNELVGPNAWRKASDWMSRGRRSVEYLLVDGMNAGSGEAFNWHKLKMPMGASRKGFALAGGLNPDNVAEAVRIVKPAVVDVSSGVTQECGIKKDHAKVTAFVHNAKSAFS